MRRIIEVDGKSHSVWGHRASSEANAELKSAMKRFRQLAIELSSMVLVVTSVLMATDHQGLVRVGEVPIPGASVQAMQDGKTFRVVTDGDGRYSIPDLSDGTWTIQVEMPGFETAKRDVTVSKKAAVEQWDLKMRTLADLNGTSEPVAGFPKTASSPPVLQPSAPEREAAARLLINGSVSNGAATPFALQRAFGNVRAPRTPYRFNYSLNGNN